MIRMEVWINLLNSSLVDALIQGLAVIKLSTVTNAVGKTIAIFGCPNGRA